MKFAPKHVVAIVVAVSAAAVLAPVGVMAATGTYVNISDPYSTARTARVTTALALQTETRAGVAADSFNNGWILTGIGRQVVAETVGPVRIALTEVTLGSHGPTNGSTSGHNFVDLVSYVQGTGTAACGTTSTGYTRTLHRRFVVMNLAPTYQVTWNGPAFLSPSAGTGKKVCLVLEVSTYTTSSQVAIAATGYRYRA